MALTDNLVAYWGLQEASGNRADSVGGQTLTDNNTVTQATGPSGLISQAALFTAANSESLSHVDSATLSAGDIDITYAAWVYLTNAAQADFGIVMAKTDGATWEFEIGYDFNVDQLYFYLESATGGSQPYATSFGTLSSATWYLVMAWHDSVNNTANIQINNGVVDSLAYSDGIRDSAHDFMIGYDNVGAAYWGGRIAGAAIWKRVLTADERTQYYNGGKGRLYPFVGGLALLGVGSS